MVPTNTTEMAKLTSTSTLHSNAAPVLVTGRHNNEHHFQYTRLIPNNDVVVSVVALEPHMKYFSLEHIPIVILALLVLLIVIVPLLVVLLISPALSRVINLTRIKPFLDEFQSCYRDSCRWYSTVYFIVWIGFVSTWIVTPTNKNSSLIMKQ